MDMVALEAQLTLDEGRIYKPYHDSVGKLTIGVGRNLSDVGVNDAEIDLMFQNDVNNAINGLNQNLPWYVNMDEIRQRVLVDLCFNLGINQLVTWNETLQLIQSGQYEAAADHLMTLPWYKEVGQRGVRLVSMMRTGEAP